MSFEPMPVVLEEMYLFVNISRAEIWYTKKIWCQNSKNIKSKKKLLGNMFSSRLVIRIQYSIARWLGGSK
jgi:hypothetical protein